MTANLLIPGPLVAEARGATLAKAGRTTDADSKAARWVARTLCHVLGAAAAILLAACQAAGPGSPGIRKAAGPLPGVGGDLPYLQTHAAVLRANRYGPLAGFNDPEVLSGYLIQGSNTMFAALAARRRA